MLKKIIKCMILMYQKTLSKIMYSRCRFYPSCSDYFLQAIEKKGIVLGFLLCLYRILRCSALSSGGYDPVE